MGGTDRADPAHRGAGVPSGRRPTRTGTATASSLLVSFTIDEDPPLPTASESGSEIPRARRPAPPLSIPLWIAHLCAWAIRTATSCALRLAAALVYLGGARNRLSITTKRGFLGYLLVFSGAVLQEVSGLRDAGGADTRGASSSAAPVEEAADRRRRLSTTHIDVKTFAELSDSIASDTEINVLNDITFTSAITITAKTNLKVMRSSARRPASQPLHTHHPSPSNLRRCHHLRSDPQRQGGGVDVRPELHLIEWRHVPHRAAL